MRALSGTRGKSLTIPAASERVNGLTVPHRGLMPG
jgi:hypothetical protein